MRFGRTEKKWQGQEIAFTHLYEEEEEGRGSSDCYPPLPPSPLPRPPLPVATVPRPIASGSPASSSCAFLLRCLVAAKDRQTDRQPERRGTLVCSGCGGLTVEAATVSGKCASPLLLLLGLLLLG